MRKLSYISSMNSKQPSWQILKEWEDILSKCLDLPIKKENKIGRPLKWWLDKHNFSKSINSLKIKSDLTLRFIMNASVKHSYFVDKNTIAVIIDFWLEEDDLPDFYDAYKDVPLILLTNMEVYNYLKSHNCPIPIEHWALSYPDKYKLSNSNLKKKKYEFCVIGRPNPFFIRLLDEYSTKHPDFEYIINNGKIDDRKYVTNHGRFVAKDTGRASYLDMIAKTKISCYTTPGLDEGKKISNSYNQVTPRLFEMLCNGCQVIGHYPKAADTEWYNLSSIIPNVSNYEEFEVVMNKFRKEPFDFKKTEHFMNQHYTSKRAESLLAILRKYNIQSS